MLEKIHNELNQRKGILIDRDHDLDGISEEEIKSELQSQGISYVLNFTKKMKLSYWTNKYFNKTVNSSPCIENLRTLSGPTSSGSSDVTAFKPTA